MTDATSPKKDDAGIWITLRESSVPVGAMLVGVLVNRLGAFFQTFLVLFLTHRGFTQVQAGVALHASLTGLPDRLSPRMGRADFFLDEAGLRLMEINWGSAVGALIEPVLQAAERAEVAIFAPMDAELYGSKGALAEPGSHPALDPDGQARPGDRGRRIHAIPELFPTERGTEEWTLTWGAFMVSRGYAGMFIRGSKDPDATVNMATGATGTCCFHEAAPRPA